MRSTQSSSLTNLASEVDTLNMFKVQAHISLSTFLTDASKTQFRTNMGGGWHQSAVTCWPRAIKYLLLMYVRNPNRNTGRPEKLSLYLPTRRRVGGDLSEAF